MIEKIGKVAVMDLSQDLNLFNSDIKKYLQRNPKLGFTASYNHNKALLNIIGRACGYYALVFEDLKTQLEVLILDKKQSYTNFNQFKTMISLPTYQQELFKWFHGQAS